MIDIEIRFMNGNTLISTHLPAVPRKGEYIDAGMSHRMYEVWSVTWDLPAKRVIVTVSDP